MPATIIPCLRYRDAPAAIEWLCEAFGFERHAVYSDDAGGIAHAQLVLGEAMIMLGSARDDAFGAVQSPADPARPVTQSAYVIVPDADAHHARSVAAGAAVVMPLKTEDYGGRGYCCRDPEGHVWSFGTYDPWKG